MKRWREAPAKMNLRERRAARSAVPPLVHSYTTLANFAHTAKARWMNMGRRRAARSAVRRLHHEEGRRGKHTHGEGCAERRRG